MNKYTHEDIMEIKRFINEDCGQLHYYYGQTEHTRTQYDRVMKALQKTRSFINDALLDIDTKHSNSF